MTENDRPQAGTHPQIFLSYSRTDLPLAKPVMEVLEAEGFTVWWDGLLEAGTVFTHTTEAALENAKAVVVLWSKTSINSHWVRDEAQSGRDTMRLVPLSIDGSMPPLGFRQFQCIDVSKTKGDPGHPAMRNALQAIHQLVDPDQPPKTIPALPLPPANRVSRRTMLIGGGAAALVGGAAITAWQTGLFGSVAVGSASLAILPFANLSDGQDKAYFSDGLSEELRAALGQYAALKVAAQASSSTASKQADGPVAIAKQLGVGYLLDGSVRLVGTELRIATQLIDGTTGFDVWSETYDRTFADIFAVQADIAQRVAAALAIAIPALGGGDPNRVGSTTNPAALDAYLRGRALYDLAADENTDRAALTQFEAAIAADGRYAVAWAAKSRAQTTIANSYGTDDTVDRLYDAAITSARKAVELAPKLADGHAALGYVLLNGRLDVAGATGPYEKSYEYGRGNADILRAYATFMTRIGGFDEARTALDSAAGLDPLNPSIIRSRGLVELNAREYAQAKTTIKKALTLNPEMSSANGWLGDIAYLEGDYQAALAYFEKEPSTLNRLRGLATVHKALDNMAEAEAALGAMREQYGTNGLYQEAEIYAQWGELDRAMTALEAAYKEGDSGLVLARNDPLLDPLRADSRFINLLDRIGFR